MNDDLQVRIISIIEKITKKKIPFVNLTGNIQEYIKLDSIQLVELFVELEQEFCIELPLNLMNVKTVEEFFSVLNTSLKEASVN